VAIPAFRRSCRTVMVMALYLSACTGYAGS
jgi:hypothetical protein